jgi:multisubunit Na+/H+ antiporter MnhF subunit
MVESILRLIDRHRTIVLTAAVALVHGAVMLRAGVHLSSDSRLYSTWGDLLLANHFNVHAFLTRTTFVVPPVLYIGWVTIVAAAKLLFGPSWAAGIVALNWVSFVVVVYLTLSTIQSLTRSPGAVLLGGLLCLVTVDIMNIEPFVLSDLVFVALSTCIIAAAVRGTPEARAAGTCFVAAACVLRPTAAPLVVFWVLALLVRDRDVTAAQLRAGAVLIAFLLAIAVLADARIMMRPATWPFAAGSGWVQQLSREYHRGIVVFDRPATFAAPPVTYGAFVALTLRKWLFYFAPVAGDYSAAHKAASLLFFVPLYLFAAIALLTWRDRRVKALIVLYVLAFSAFHAVQQIDFDYRYRLPVLPALMVLAGVGWAAAHAAWRGRSPSRAGNGSMSL